MKRAPFHRCISLLLIAALSALAVQGARADDTSPISGSYRVVRLGETGGQTRVRLQLHFVNRGRDELHIQRITLWDFSHPGKGRSQTCSIVVHSASSAESEQEFTVPRAEIELWRRGARPRLVLEVATAGQSHTAVVRLDRAPGGKGN